MSTSLLCDEPDVAAAVELEAMLRQVPGVTFVSTKPTEKDSRKRKPNHFGVSYKVRLASGEVLPRRMPCTEPDAPNPRPTLADALRAAIKSACTELGVEMASVLEPTMAAPAEEEATAAELEWLADWCESHAAPETITVEMAHAELVARRYRAVGEASSSSAAGGVSALMRLQQAHAVSAQEIQRELLGH